MSDLLQRTLKVGYDIQTQQRDRIRQLEAALTLLTNGFKYSTEVVTIARNALAETPPHLRGPVIQAYADTHGVKPK